MSAANPIGTGTVTSAPVYRGGPSKAPQPTQFTIQSINASFSWGSAPGEGTIVYDYESVPVTVGWSVQLVVAGHVLNGMCIDDSPVNSSGGNRRVLKFADNRYWLAKDQVYCSFNQLDDAIVNNVRVKRYVHHLPDLNFNVELQPASFQPSNFVYSPDGTTLLPPTFQSGPYYLLGGIKTYTTCPLTAAQIIVLILNATTVRDSWAVSFQPDMFNNPVWNIDATGGKSLAAILQEISDQQGLVFTNMGGPFNLVWVRKGVYDARFQIPTSLLPTPETNPSTGQTQILADDIVNGTSLSENPTNIGLLGDRNVYMPLNIPMVPSWSPGWDQFWYEEFFIADVYNRGSTQQPVTIGNQTWPAGTPFRTIGSSTQDPEQIIARQVARAYALEITVAQYAILRNEALFVDPPNFADYQKYAGKTRLDMPCVLYIRRILLRAFNFPQGFTITNWNGVNVPIDSMEIMDKMIARVTYDPVTGIMTANPNQAADGNGLAIVQGYQVGQQMFEKINPDRFNLAAWAGNAPNIWQAAQFEIDDTGEPGEKFIIFDGPIFKSATFFQSAPWMNGYAVYNIQPTKVDGTPGLDVPQVQCTVCFAAERFYFFETGEISAGATETYPIGGLNRELVFTYGTTGWTEVLYSDGLTANEKAQLFINPLTLNQYIYEKGGYKHPLNANAKGQYPTAISLSPLIDKVTVETSPSGVEETINFTTEYPRLTYTPERDLDRNVKLKTLLPGQEQLRNDSLFSKMAASALAQSPYLYATMANAFKEVIGNNDPTSTIPVLGTPSTPGASHPVVTLNAGTPLWSLPGVANSNGTRSNTVAVPPNAATPTAQHSVFQGVTMQHNWPAGDGRDVPVQRAGTIYARVMGPVQPGDPVGQVVASGSGIPDYLSANASGNFVGTAQEAIATAVIQLIRVQVGSTLPSEATVPFEVLKVSETQVSINPESALLASLNITDQLEIFGLDTPFTVTNGTLIYLEVLFDINNNPLFANMATAGANQIPIGGGAPIPTRTGWRMETTQPNYTSASAYPELIGTIDENNLTPEQNLLSIESAFWVNGLGTAQANYETAQKALAAFTPANAPARFQQYYAYALIAFCTNSQGATGITLNGAGKNTSFTVVQCIETHLMLQGFCSGGVPSQLPVPYSGPMILPLPAPTITAATSSGVKATITMPSGYQDATIWYSLDGAEFIQYSGPFSVTAQGTHTIEAYATQPGYFESPLASGQFVI